MKSAIIFIENYLGGGSDKVARILVDSLPFKKIYLFVNKSNDTSTLLSKPLKENVDLIRYDLFTVIELRRMSNSSKSIIAKILLKVIYVFIRYPMILFSILYFYLKFKKFDVDIFIANNGGYPGAEYCRSATIAASLIPKLKVFHIFHNMPMSSSIIFAPFEWIYDYLIDTRCQIISVSYAAIKSLKEKRNIKQDVKCVYNGLPKEFSLYG